MKLTEEDVKKFKNRLEERIKNAEQRLENPKSEYEKGYDRAIKAESEDLICRINLMQEGNNLKEHFKTREEMDKMRTQLGKDIKENTDTISFLNNREDLTAKEAIALSHAKYDSLKKHEALLNLVKNQIK